jgi:hypothetical protein
MERIQLKTDLDALALLELFWIEPKSHIPQDGYMCYELKDNSGITLVFGVNIIEESVDIKLKIAETTLVTLSYEQVQYFDIIDVDKGIFSFSFTPESLTLNSYVQIELRPKIKISSSIINIGKE